MDSLRFKSDCSQPLGICVKTKMGQMVLPKTGCACAQGIGPGRVTIPPIIWLIVGMGVLLYAWLSNRMELHYAWQSMGWAGVWQVAKDLGNLLLALTIFGVILVWGAFYEWRKRKEELAERLPFLNCEK